MQPNLIDMYSINNDIKKKGDKAVLEYERKFSKITTKQKRIKLILNL